MGLELGLTSPLKILGWGHLTSHENDFTPMGSVTAWAFFRKCRNGKDLEEIN